MSTDVNVQEPWAIEPELGDRPPRRLVASEYPDLNQPNAMLLYGIGGVLAVVGIILLVVSMSKGSGPLIALSFLLMLGGGATLIFAPMKVQKYRARVQHLAENGMPIMARILSADNMTGDSTYGRSIRYQVPLPSGDMVHRQVNVDERALPKRIPANVTALVDMSTSDVELYCALPLRAVSKNAPVHVPTTPGTTPTSPVINPTTATVSSTSSDAFATLPTSSPATNNGKMGTIGVAPVPHPQDVVPKTEPVPVPTPDKPEGQKTTKSGLPWE